MKKTKAEIRARRKRIRLIRRVAALSCVAVLLVACGVLGVSIMRESRRAKTLASLQSMYSGNNVTAYAESSNDATQNPDATQAPAQNAGATTSAPANSPDDVQDDFAELYAQNNHFVAWLDAGDTISLPVVQSDNSFYLDHDYFGKHDEGGTLFVNAGNTLWPQDQHILIHGHNMKDGSMFAALTKYRELDYLQKNSIVYLRTIRDEQPVAYVPVAVFDASMTKGANGYFALGHIKFETEDEFLTFADSMVQRSIYNIPVDIQADDHLLSLVTCSYDHDNGRLIVVCRALREGETIENMQQVMLTATQK